MKKLISILMGYSIPFYTIAYILGFGFVDGIVYSIATWLSTLIIVSLFLGNKCLETT